MLEFDKMSVEELVRAEGYDCECGKHHVCALKYLKIGRGVIANVAEMVAALGCKKPFVVCDQSTYEVAAKKVCEYLDAAGVAYTLYVIPSAKPAPDEWTIGNVVMHFDMTCDLLLGVGSGVVNDTCKEVAFKTGRVNAIVGTAPSMDGFASATSSMEVDHVKVSLNNQCPQGVLLDADVLAQAPVRMLWAGLGDMIAKYVAICEWRISHLITGEYYCEAVAQLMRSALSKIMANVEKLMARDPDAVAAVAEGLVIAGVGMAYAGISRPASGLEHYFSHMWEMMALERGLPYDLHGIQVGVGTVLSLKLYQWIRQLRPDRAKMDAHAAAFDPVAWEAQVRRIFGKTAVEIISIENKTHKNDPGRLRKRMDAICDHWDEILEIIGEELPEFDPLYAVLETTGMPLLPKDINISDEDTLNAYLGARDIRDKYLSCSMLWDMGLEREAADYLLDSLHK